MVTATMTGDCRYMSLVLSGNQGMGQVTVSNGSLTYQTYVNLPTGNATYNSVIDLQTSVGTRDGIFVIRLTDSLNDVSETAVLGRCSLLCCVAKKMDTILGCDCGCSKCQLALTQANRVNLLIVAIESKLNQLGTDPLVNQGIITNVTDLYNKGVDLCTDSCGCGC